MQYAVADEDENLVLENLGFNSGIIEYWHR